MSQRAVTTIVSPDGILALAEIGDTGGSQTQLINIDIQGQTAGFQTATEFIRDGNQLGKKLTMKSGVELEASSNHSFRRITSSGLFFDTVSNLQVGHVIPYRIGGYNNMINYQSLTGTPSTFVEDAGWFLGLYYANGTDITDGVRVTGLLEDIIKFSYLLDRVFSVSLSFERLTDHVGQVTTISPSLVTWLSDNGLLRGDDSSVQLPLVLRKSPIPVLHQFFDGYFSSNNAYFPLSNKPRNNYERRVVTIPNQLMAQAFALTLRALGVEASIGFDDSQSLFFVTYIPILEAPNFKDGNFNFIYDEIESVENTSRQMFDLTVSGGNIYVSNSYIGMKS